MKRQEDPGAPEEAVASDALQTHTSLLLLCSAACEPGAVTHLPEPQFPRL